ncbi:McrB family protein [Vibrio sp. 10N.222.49.A3]|uniref:McrB family protein n=1 Tax=Vibrio sp. 10N.222.49.A3 TaxID=3229611 RepID=UPI0035502080
MDVLELKSSLDHMVNENPRNSTKNKKVIDWFERYLKEPGRASVVNEDKQVGNRIPEQFKHHAAHVIFVCKEKKVLDSISRRVEEFKYDELETVLVLQESGGSIDFSLEAELLLFSDKSKVVPFYIKEIPGLIVKEDLLPLYAEATDELRLSKPFLLFAGISGTGKTRFIREQARSTGSIEDTYCLTSVRPDWHEPSDLLGYVSRLSGNTEYIVTDVLKFIVKAWIAIKDAGITLQGKEVVGEKSQQQQVKPYWLCLDEMNLAPVEQYFADYLSVLETREWAWQGNDFIYQCDPLLKATVFEAVDKNKLKGELGLIDHDELWDHFVTNGISIPFNLIVAGTVNMDETTHGFSRKVIDRALTFDFGEFFPNDFDAFFDATSEPKALSYPVLTDGRNKTELSSTFDKDGTLSVAFLKQINEILGNTPFKLAYRALNELLLAVITQNPNNEIELQSVWDDFLMCKVLPRIEGDIDKLTKRDSGNSILEQLSSLLSDQLNEIWATKSRQDLFRKSLEGDPLITIECRSKVKLEWMSDQLKNGFTSFWP